MEGVTAVGGAIASFLTGVAAIIGGMAAWRKASGDTDTGTARAAEEALKRERALVYYVMVLRDCIRHKRPPPPPPWPPNLTDYGYGAEYDHLYEQQVWKTEP